MKGQLSRAQQSVDYCWMPLRKRAKERTLMLVEGCKMNWDS